MAVGIYDSTFKGLIETVIRDKTDDLIFVLPAAAGGVYNTGIELGEIESVNCRGVRVTGKRFPNVEKPTLQLDFGSRPPELLAMKLGRKFEQQATVDTFIERSGFIVPPNGIVNAKPAGTLGFGVAANAVTNASYMNDQGFSVKMTQDPDFATFNPTAAGNEFKFAVGANSALKFGSALWERPVGYKIPTALTNIYKLGAGAYTNLAATAVLVTQNLKIVRWSFSGVSVDNTGDIPLQEPTQQVSFFVEGDYDLEYLDQLTPLLMRPHLIEYSNGEIAIVYPCPRSRLPLFELLIQRLLKVWKNYGMQTYLLAESRHGWQLIEAIAGLLPSEKRLPFRLDPLKSDLHLLQQLFLIQENEQPGELVQIHLFESKPRPPRDPDKPLTVYDLPFPSCGNADCDTLANLIHNLGFDQGDRMFRELDAESLDKIFSVMNELNRDPQERLQAYVANAFERWKEQNAEVYQQAKYGKHYQNSRV